MEHLIADVGNWVATVIKTLGSHGLGYWAVVLMMGIESACIPLPSEVIMPVGGYLSSISPDRYSIWGMGISGAFGCVWGSVIAYWAGMKGGRPFLEKYGKYILIRHKDLDKADTFFSKYGVFAIFISRLLPVVRTFISFPAGIARVPFVKFVVYTFLGSLPWCIALAYFGKKMGDNWMDIKKYFHGADVVIVAVFVLGLAFYIYHHVKPEKPSKGKC